MIDNIKIGTLYRDMRVTSYEVVVPLKIVNYPYPTATVIYNYVSDPDNKYTISHNEASIVWANL